MKCYVHGMESFIENLSALNPLAVAGSALAIWLVGALWFSPLLFGRTYIRLSGVRPGDVPPADVRRARVVYVLTAVVNAVLLGLLAAQSQSNIAMLFSCIFIIWLFLMLGQLNGCVSRREPFAMFLLITVRSLLALLAGGLSYTLWS